MTKGKTKQMEQEASSRRTVLSQEKIVDSDSDSPEESGAELVMPAPAQQGHAKDQIERKKKGSTNEKKHKVLNLESSSENESANVRENNTDVKASEEESENDSNASSLGSTKRPAPPTKAASPKKKAKPTGPTAIAPQPFKPPNGFEKTTFSPLDYAADSTEFLSEDLHGKQIWHITAPASVNIKDIKPFNIQDVRSGKPVFSKNGVDYGFLTGLHKTERLLLAEDESLDYTQATAAISGTYHLREISRSKMKGDAEAGKENTAPSFAAQSTIPAKKPREQPAGLQMRYQPYGSTTITEDHSLSASQPVFYMTPELPESHLDKSKKKNKKKMEEKGSQWAREDLQVVDAMDVDPTPSSTVKNPESGKPSESARQMVNKVFEAATETTLKEKKRKKKKHRIETEV